MVNIYASDFIYLVTLCIPALFMFIFESETGSYIPQMGMGCSNICTYLLHYNWHTKLKPFLFHSHNYGKPRQFYS